MIASVQNSVKVELKEEGGKQFVSCVFQSEANSTSSSVENLSPLAAKHLLAQLAPVVDQLKDQAAFSIRPYQSKLVQNKYEVVGPNGVVLTLPMHSQEALAARDCMEQGYRIAKGARY